MFRDLPSGQLKHIDQPGNPRKRLLRNTIFSALSWGVPLGLAFIATPIIVNSLGTAQYGIYALVLGFLSYAFSSGTGKVVAKYIPEYRTAGESDKLSEAVSASLWLTLGLGLCQLGLLAILAPYIVADLLLIEAENQAQVINALYLAGLAGLAVMLGQVFQFALQGVHRFDIYSLVTAAVAVVMTSGNIVLVLSGYGVVPLFAWNVIISAAAATVFFASARPFVPEWKPGFAVRRTILTSVAGYAGSIILYQLLNNILGVFERSWIVRKFGPDALSFYVIALMLGVYMHGLLWSGAQVLFPVVNEMLDDREGLERLYQKSAKLLVIGASLIVIVYICCGRQFLGHWIGSDFAEHSYYPLIYVSLSFGFSAAAIPSWMTAEAFRAPALNALNMAIWTAAAIPMMIVAADRWQIDGIGLARMVGAFLTLFVMTYVEARFLGRVLWRFWFNLLVRIGVSGLIVVVVVDMIFGGMRYGWMVLAGQVLITGLIFLGAMILTGALDRKEIASFLSLLEPSDGAVAPD